MKTYLDSGSGFVLKSSSPTLVFSQSGDVYENATSRPLAIQVPGVNVSSTLRIVVTPVAEADQSFEITLHPAVITTVEATPNPVEAGQSAAVTVTLQDPAPPGGQRIIVTTATTGLRGVLMALMTGSNRSETQSDFTTRSLVIPQGENTATIQVSTMPGTSARNLVFHAQAPRDGASQTVTLSLPAQASVSYGQPTLTVSSPLVSDGDIVEFTLTLPSPAPASGVFAGFTGASAHNASGYFSPQTAYVGLPLQADFYIPPGQTSVTRAFEVHNSGSAFVDRSIFAWVGEAVTPDVSVRVMPQQLECSWSADGGGDVFDNQNGDGTTTVLLNVYIDNANCVNGPAHFSITSTLSALISQSLPLNVQIPAGQTSLEGIELTFSGVASVTNGSITVTFLDNPAMETETLNVTVFPPPDFNDVSLQFIPPLAAALDTVEIQIGLERPAGPGGAAVLLGGNTFDLDLPPFVVIPEGRRHLTLLRTVPCGSSIPLTASFDSTTANATLTIDFPDELGLPFPDPLNPLASVMPITILQPRPQPLRCDQPTLIRLQTLQPAPAGGLDIEIGHSYGLFHPATVHLPGGQNVVDFAVQLDPDTLPPDFVEFPPQIAAWWKCVEANEVLLNVDTSTTYSLTGLSITENAVYGPANVLVHLTLNQAAPAGGLVLPLQLATTGADTLPPYVVIPEGSATAAVPLSLAAAIGLDRMVTVEARLCGAPFSDTVTVLAPIPIRLVDLAVSPHLVDAGTGATGTVTLSSAAPPGGIAVDLEVFYPGAQVPAVVTVAEGDTTATFPVTTYATCRQEGLVVLEARLGTDADRETLSINSPLCPALQSAGFVPAGNPAAGASSTVRVTLDAPAPAAGMSVTFSSDDPGVIVPGSLFIPGGSTTLDVPVTVEAGCHPAASRITARTGNSWVTLPFQVLNASCASLVSLQVAPQPSSDGEILTGSIQIDQVAGGGGVNVRLESLNANLAVPALVTVPFGQNTATFPVRTALVSRESKGYVRATLGSGTLTEDVDLSPSLYPRVMSFTLDRARAMFGDTVTGTIQLDNFSPAGGLEIFLSARPASPITGLPASLRIPAGEQSVSFTFGVAEVASDTPVILVVDSFTREHTHPLLVVRNSDPGGSSFGAWATAFFAPGEEPDPNEVPPGGVLPYFAYYALAPIDPGQPGGLGGNQLFEFNPGDDSQSLTPGEDRVSFYLRRDARDVVVEILHATDPGNWKALPQDAARRIPYDAERDRVEIRRRIGDGENLRFYGMRIAFEPESPPLEMEP